MTNAPVALTSTQLAKPRHAPGLPPETSAKRRVLEGCVPVRAQGGISQPPVANQALAGFLGAVLATASRAGKRRGGEFWA